MEKAKYFIFDKLYEVNTTGDDWKIQHLIYHINSQYQKLKESNYRRMLVFNESFIEGLLFTLSVLQVVDSFQWLELHDILFKEARELEERLES